MILKYVIDEDNIMVKDFLYKKVTSKLQTVVKQYGGVLLVNNCIVENYYLMSKGDILEVVLPKEEKNDNIKPVFKDFDILYEDSYLLIIDKAKDVAVIPTHKHFEDSLANFVMAYYIKKGIASGIHFVNRLDAPTSGIVILAKNRYIADSMKQAIKTKKYLLIVEGTIEKEKNQLYEITSRIEKDPSSVIKRHLVEGIPNSKTIYEVLASNNNQTLIEATLVTGKTHQLRLHFASMCHPIIGDELYGHCDEKGLQLHSYMTEFVHPVTKETIVITSLPILEDWQYYLELHQ